MKKIFNLIIVLLFNLTSLAGNEPVLKVGVFNGNGASVVCVTETMEALKIDSGIVPQIVSATDIMNNVLDSLDVLIFPGGSASKEYNNLGLLAANKVKAFAKKKNKGLVGICAGAYLFSTTPGYPSLQIFKAPDIRDHYDRGRALIGFTVNKEGGKIFPELSSIDTAFYQYYDGPMFNIPEGSGITVLATITTDISHKKGYPKGVTPGKPAFFTAKYGEGKVIASVGHPEATPGMRWIVPRMARFVANRQLISYTTKVVRPKIYSHEILYTNEIIKKEKDAFWQLFSPEEKTIIQSINYLHSIYSRPSIRWSIGLLRHPSPLVRQKAAEYLLETEYTAALNDIHTALKQETDPKTKELLKKSYQELKEIID